MSTTRNSDDCPDTSRYTIHETVTATLSNDTLYIPIPDEFVEADCVTNTTAYLPRYYYNPDVQAPTLFLTRPEDTGDYTPFKHDEETLFTAVRTPDQVSVSTRYTLEGPGTLFSALSLEDFAVHWVFVETTPAIVFDTEPCPDPCADAMTRVTDTVQQECPEPVTGIKYRFQDLSSETRDCVPVLDRQQIKTLRVSPGAVQHAIPLQTGVEDLSVDSFYWEVTPTTTPHRVQLTVAPVHESGSEARGIQGCQPVQRDADAVLFPVPRCVSNLLDMPGPRGAVWIDSDPLTVIV